MSIIRNHGLKIIDKMTSMEISNEQIWKRVAHLKQGGSFGELALIEQNHGKRQATIKCT